MRWNAFKLSSHSTEFSGANGSIKNSNSSPSIGVIYLSVGVCNTLIVNVVERTTSPPLDVYSATNRVVPYFAAYATPFLTIAAPSTSFSSAFSTYLTEAFFSSIDIFLSKMEIPKSAFVGYSSPVPFK